MKVIDTNFLSDKSITVLTNPAQKEVFLQELSNLRVLFHGTIAIEDEFYPSLSVEGVEYLSKVLGWSYDRIDRDKVILERMNSPITTHNPDLIALDTAFQQLQKLGYFTAAKRTLPDQIWCLNHVTSDSRIASRVVETLRLRDANLRPFVHFSDDLTHTRRLAFYQVVEWLKQGVDIDCVHLLNVHMEDAIELMMWFQEAKIPFDYDASLSIKTVPFLDEMMKFSKQGNIRASIDWIQSKLNQFESHPSLDAIVRLIKEYPIERWEKMPDLFWHRLQKLTFRMEFMQTSVHMHTGLEIQSADAYYIILNYTEEDMKKTIPLTPYLDTDWAELGLPSPIDIARNAKEQTILLLSQLAHVSAFALRQDVPGNKAVFSDGFPHFPLPFSIPVDASYAPRMEAQFFGAVEELGIPEFSGLSASSVAFLTNNQWRLSASKLETYFECPFRFLLEEILKIRQSETSFAQFYGNFMHDVLDHAFQNETLDINGILHRHQDEFPKEELYKWAIYRENILSSAEKVVQSVREIRGTSKFEQIFSEGYFETNLDGDQSVKVVGRVDALLKKSYDIQTVFAVIDYKTGQEGFRSNDFRSLRQLQLLVYLYLVKNQPTNVNWDALGGFYQKAYYPFIDDETSLETHFQLDGFAIKDAPKLRDFADEASLKGISTNKDGSFKKSPRLFDKNELDQLMKDFEDLLKKTLNHLRQGHFWMRAQKGIPFELAPSGCQYCPFAHVCARKNHSDTAEGGEENGIDETSNSSD